MPIKSVRDYDPLDPVSQLRLEMYRRAAERDLSPAFQNDQIRRVFPIVIYLAGGTENQTESVYRSVETILSLENCTLVAIAPEVSGSKLITIFGSTNEPVNESELKYKLSNMAPVIHKMAEAIRRTAQAGGLALILLGHTHLIAVGKVENHPQLPGIITIQADKQNEAREHALRVFEEAAEFAAWVTSFASRRTEEEELERLKKEWAADSAEGKERTAQSGSDPFKFLDDMH
jgi:hypothetical protein